MLSLGEMVRGARERQQLTQEDLASRLGLTHAQISRIETGKSQTDLETITALSETLGLDRGALVRAAEETRRRWEAARETTEEPTT